MTTTNSRNEEVKRRILQWEQENNNQECSREEWRSDAGNNGNDTSGDRGDRPSAQRSGF